METINSGDIVRSKSGDVYMILQKGFSKKLHDTGFMVLNNRLTPRYLPIELIDEVIGHKNLGGIFKSERSIS